MIYYVIKIKKNKTTIIINKTKIYFIKINVKSIIFLSKLFIKLKKYINLLNSKLRI